MSDSQKGYSGSSGSQLTDKQVHCWPHSRPSVFPRRPRHTPAHDIYKRHCSRRRGLTTVNDDGVQEVAQAIPAQLLKKHRSIENDGIDPLLGRGLVRLEPGRVLMGQRKISPQVPDFEDMQDAITFAPSGTLTTGHHNSSGPPSWPCQLICLRCTWIVGREHQADEGCSKQPAQWLASVRRRCASLRQTVGKS